VEPDHTRVELEHRGWERLGDLADQARSSYEGGWPGVLDRALACAGDLDQAAGWHSRATAAGATVANDEDRKIFTEDLATGPWFGLGAA
jgi:hypothetical protein